MCHSISFSLYTEVALAAAAPVDEAVVVGHAFEEDSIKGR